MVHLFVDAAMLGLRDAGKFLVESFMESKKVCFHSVLILGGWKEAVKPLLRHDGYFALNVLVGEVVTALIMEAQVTAEGSPAQGARTTAPGP